MKHTRHLECVSFFCAACLLEQTTGKGVSPPAILGLGAPGLLAGRLRCRRRRRERRMGLLPFGLLLNKALLLAGPTFELALVLAPALLLPPGLQPATIEQGQTQREHGIDVLGSPMHAWPFQTRLHHDPVTAFCTPRPNRPALLLIGRIVHQLAPLLQVVDLLLDLRIVPG